MRVYDLCSHKQRDFVYLTNHITCMKKKIIYAACLIVLAYAATSCKKILNNCEFCKIVTRTSGGTEVSSTGETEYCGADLIAFKAANPTITNPVTGNITKVECH